MSAVQPSRDATAQLESGEGVGARIAEGTDDDVLHSLAYIQGPYTPYSVPSSRWRGHLLAYIMDGQLWILWRNWLDSSCPNLISRRLDDCQLSSRCDIGMEDAYTLVQSHIAHHRNRLQEQRVLDPFSSVFPPINSEAPEKPLGLYCAIYGHSYKLTHVTAPAVPPACGWGRTWRCPRPPQFQFQSSTSEDMQVPVRTDTDKTPSPRYPGGSVCLGPAEKRVPHGPDMRDEG